MSPRSLVFIAIATGLLACARPSSPDASEAPAASAERHAAEASSDAKAPPRKPPEARRMYRLDFTFSTSEAGKPEVRSAYTLNLEENSVGEVRLGSNIPLQVSRPAASASASAAPSLAGLGALGAPRQDVGFLLRCTLNVAGEDVLLHSDVEMSSADQPPAIHKMTLKGDALVAPGKPSVVSSSEDPTTHQRYQLSVTATKLR